MAAPSPTYRPIDCSVHDRLEALAVRGVPATFAWQEEEGGERSATARILDIRVEGGAEWLLLESGERIRLDRLQGFTADPGRRPEPLPGATRTPADEDGPRGCGTPARR